MAFKLIKQEIDLAELRSLRFEIENIIALPASYLDPDIAIKPQTGEELYDRWNHLGNHLRNDFPLLKITPREFPIDRDLNVPLDRSELASLLAEANSLIGLIEPLAN